MSSVRWHEDVAIIGMAGLFPEAANLDQFHHNLLSGRDSVRPIPEERVHFSTMEPRDDYPLLGCLDRIDLFDHRFFNISLREAEYMDPHQRLTLQLVVAAIENAGYGPGSLRGTPTGVFLSVPRAEYATLYRDVDPLGLLGGATSAVPGRVSYHLDLQGPSVGLDAGCAGSLIAVDAACRELLLGDAPVAIAGGVSVNVLLIARDIQLAFSEIVSPDEKCKAFDAEANGSTAGEGGAIVVLKRLRDAIADGDHIHAVIKGSAVNQNGFRSNGLSAPSPAAQTEVILEAWRRSGVDPATIHYIEAHGSGTRLGDVIEVQGLTEAFKACGVAERQCAIGSVKTNIGHLDHAAGIAGLAKAVLALRHRSLYPSLHFTSPNPLVDWERAPVFVNDQPRAWEASGGEPRRAGVSSFSLAGANAHLVLQEAPPPRPVPGSAGPSERGRVLVTVSAKSSGSLREACLQLGRHVEADGQSVEQLGYVLNAGRDDHRMRHAFAAADREELLLRLKEVGHLPVPQAVPQTGRPLVLLFSGDGRVDDTVLAASFPAAREAIDEVRALAGSAATKPAVQLFALQYGLYRLLHRLGLREDAVLGSGVGNFMARVVRGLRTLPEAVELAARAEVDAQFDWERLVLAVEELAPQGPVFLEVGLGGVLSESVARMGHATVDVEALVDPSADAPVLSRVARLYELGVPIDWHRFYEGAGLPKTEVPTYPFDEVRCWCRPAGDYVTTEGMLVPEGAPAVAIDEPPPLADVFATDTERKVAEVWRAALKVPIDDSSADYFELGGTSVIALNVVDGLEAAFGIRIQFLDLYESSTVEALAAYLDGVLAGGGDLLVEPPIVPVSRDQDLLLSFEQERLWFLDRFEPNSPLYNIPMDIRLEGRLDLEALRRTLEDLVTRHEALRTHFPAVNGEPRMAIKPPGRFELPLIDLSDRPEEEAVAEARRLLAVEGAKPFDLTVGPMFRAQVTRLAEHHHVLLMTFHHIVDDGWSPAVLHREISALYAGHLEGKPVELDPLPVQYADYAQWQRRWLSGEVLERKIAYWKEHLAGVPPLELPTDRPRPPIQTFSGGLLEFQLPADLVAALRRLSREEGVTTFSTLLAAFSVLMHRYSGQDDFAVATPTAGRNRPETRDLIGFFNNSVPLRVDLSGQPTFREFLRRLRMVVAGGLDHQDIPFEKIVEVLQPERDLSRNPIFQVMYTHQNSPTEPYNLPGLEVGSLRGGLVSGVVQGTAKFDLTLGITDIDEWESMPGMVEFNTDLFDEATALAMLDHFEHLLRAIADDPDRTVARLPMMGEVERRRVVREWNDTRTPYEPACLHRLFEAQVARTPGAVAVVAGDAQLTFDELNRRANQLAHWLLALGVGPDVRVGLSADKSVEMVVGILGIQKAGGAYVPLDPSYPAERLAFMRDDAGIEVVLTQEQLERDWRGEPDTNPDSGVGSDNLAYVIYTSGSTGVPKGVMVPHRGLRNLADEQRRAWGLGEGKRVLQFVSYSFDASVSDWLMGLTTGATLVLATGDARLPGPALVAMLQEQRITHLTMPPSVLAALPCDPKELPDLEAVLAAGEACPADIVARWQPGRRLFNPYGPTEATVYVTLVECTEPRPRPNIGRPMANSEIYVLDEHMDPVPAGVFGELYIGGVGLARGYHQRPDLTAERFVAHPWEEACLYRTGDIGRWLRDGTIEFQGRADTQVKVRGFRIELGEIEAVLAGHPAVAKAVVVARDDVSQLVAYVVPRTDVDPTDLRQFLAGKLPDYMVPSLFVTLEHLPLSPNGKLDRAALPVPSPERRDRFEPPASPTEEVIARIWAKVIGIDRVGAGDNFFELGGHSLLATQVTSRIRDTLQADLPVRLLFEAPTVRALAPRVAAALGGVGVADEVSATVLQLEDLSDEEVAALLAEGEA